MSRHHTQARPGEIEQGDTGRRDSRRESNQDINDIYVLGRETRGTRETCVVGGQTRGQIVKVDLGDKREIGGHTFMFHKIISAYMTLMTL